MALEFYSARAKKSAWKLAADARTSTAAIRTAGEAMLNALPPAHPLRRRVDHHRALGGTIEWVSAVPRGEVTMILRGGRRV